jgi:glycerol-3-phosphate acyltransferase PlsY
MVSEIIYIVIAYLVGSIPSGFIVARLNGISDIRSHGSGNIGATNVARVLGMRYFFIIFALDFLKAVFCLSAFAYCGLSRELLIGAAVALLLGNAFPIFLRFSGGKGVATTFGIVFSLHAYLFAVLLLLWAAVFSLKRTVGIASIVALVLLPVCTLFIACETAVFLGLTLFMSGFGLFLHRNNIRRHLIS